MSVSYRRFDKTRRSVLDCLILEDGTVKSQKSADLIYVAAEA